ncbi:hypothetical protein THRCLA_10337, partial [Thraustotheca clavata]
MDVGDLTTYINNIANPSTFSIRIKLHIALSIAQALEYSHDQNCVHCDVRADNVYLNSKLQVKLNMLVLFQRLTNDDGVEPFPLPGTYVWVAPEIVNVGKYTKTSDVYSFGILLTMLYTLKKPSFTMAMKNYPQDEKSIDIGTYMPIVPSKEVKISDIFLGSGGFGPVIWGSYNNQAVAVKQLRSATLKNRTQAKKFCFGLLMEYMGKGDLRRYLDSVCSSSSFLPWPTRVSMAFQLIQGIDFLHGMNIVHRDIKSLN